MMRVCHLDTCPVGVATQNPELRKRFTGQPEFVENFFRFVADEVREILAALGVRALNDVVGRADLLTQVSRGSAYLDDLDLNPILAVADPGGYPRFCTVEGRNEVPDTLDAQIIEDAGPLFEVGEKMQLQYTVRNTHRAIGTKLSSKITRRFGMAKLRPGHICVRLRGSAGQSLGAFAVQGLKLEMFGDANDYVGKGLSGGTIVVRPMTASPLVTQDNTIIGNTVLYGATAGKLFAAGMTGGMAFVYDPDEVLPLRINPQGVVFQRLESDHWEALVKSLIEEHHEETQSRFAQRLLIHWQQERGHFWQVVPREMLERLEQPLSDAEAAQRA
jgi:glutamate synthase (NADPH/NADH) large chain